MKIKLITMPFDVVLGPNPALSILTPAVEARGHVCEGLFFSMEYASRMDWELYDLIATHPKLYDLLLGEWLFSKSVGKAYSEGYVAMLAEKQFAGAETERLIGDLQAMWEETPAFIADCYRSVDWGACGLVGFSSRNQTLNASLALARRIKAEHPDLPVIFGGVNAQLDQGRQLLRSYDCIDFVCVGEGEVLFPDLADCLDRMGDPAGVPGLAWRDAAGAVVLNPPPPVVQEMDALPTPDFDDYFAARARCAVPEAEVALPYRLSRGCSWREQTGGCTYCAVDCLQAGHRRKSAGKVVDDLNRLIRKYDCRAFRFDDDYASPALFEILAALEESDQTIRFSIATKADITKEALRRIKKGGGQEVFVGVENFTNRVLLGLMHKGIDAITNIRVIRYCYELDLNLRYYIILGMPGETEGDVQEMAARMEHLHHLPPPTSVFRLQLLNHSILESHQDEYGLRNQRPPDFAKDIFAFDDPEELMNLVPFYAFDYADGQDVERKYRIFKKAASRWLKHYQRSILVFVADDVLLRILDTRPVAAEKEHRFTGLAKDIYLACRGLATERALLEAFAGEAGRVRGILDDLVEKRLVATDGVRYLSLALDLSERMPTRDLIGLSTARLEKLAELAYGK